MPMYEYQCTACGHRFEVIQKFSDKPVKKCPHCGKAGKAVERLVSSSAIQFKGSGWYVTDYAKRSGPADLKRESKDGKQPAKEAASPASEKKEPAKESSSSSASPPNSATK